MAGDPELSLVEQFMTEVSIRARHRWRAIRLLGTW